MIKIKHVGTFFGPNPFSAKKAIVFEIKITASFSDDYYVSRTNELKDLLPSDFECLDCTGRHGLIKYIAKFLLEFLNYKRGDLRFSEVKYWHGKRVVVMDFHNELVNLEVLKRLCSWLFTKMIDCDAFKKEIHALWNLCQKYHPDFQAHALIEGAKSKGCSYLDLGGKYWVYGLGKGSKIFFETSLIYDRKAPKFSKLFCKSIFADVGAPTAQFALINAPQDEERVAEEIGYKCVTKPINGGSGRGITANISNYEEFTVALEHARLYGKDGAPILVEKHYEGFDYRLLFINGKFEGCVKRDAPFVIGDGDSSIEKLIAIENQKTTASFYKSNYQRPIKIDEKIHRNLATQNLKLSSVLNAGRKIYLLSSKNASGGGKPCISHSVHPKIMSDANNLAKKLGIYSLGIDYISTDISKDPEEIKGVFTEFNKTPGVAAFIAAGYAPSDVGSRFLGHDCLNVDICVYIIPENKLSETLQITKLEHALIAPNYILKHGKLRKQPKKSFLTALAIYASDVSLEKLNVILPETHVQKHGLVENLTSVIVDDDVSLSTVNFLKLSNISYFSFSHCK